MYKKQEKYSIRKYKVAVASVLVSVGLIFSGLAQVEEVVKTHSIAVAADLQDSFKSEIDKTKQKLKESSDKIIKLITENKSLSDKERASMLDDFSGYTRVDHEKIDNVARESNSLEELRGNLKIFEDDSNKMVAIGEVMLAAADKKAEVKANKNLSNAERNSVNEIITEKMDDIIAEIEDVFDNVEQETTEIKERLAEDYSKINPVGAQTYVENLEHEKETSLKSIDSSKLAEKTKKELKAKLESNIQNQIDKIKSIAEEANKAELTADEASGEQSKITDDYKKTLKIIAASDVAVSTAEKTEDIENSGLSEKEKQNFVNKLAEKEKEILQALENETAVDQITELTKKGKEEISKLAIYTFGNADDKVITDISEYTGGAVPSEAPTREELPEYTGAVVPSEAPTREELPEFTGGVADDEAPTNEVPEYTGEQSGAIVEPEVQPELPEYKDGAVPSEAPTQEELPEYSGAVVPSEAPTREELPEFTGGVADDEAPTNEVPEYTGEQSGAIVEPEVQPELPEYKIGVVPSEAPTREELPEYTGGVADDEAPIREELPEYTGAVVPSEAPTREELPEYTGGVADDEAPIREELPEYTGAVVPSEAPTREELPEYTGGVADDEAPINEVPEYTGVELLGRKNSAVQPKIPISNLSKLADNGQIIDKTESNSLADNQSKLPNTGKGTLDTTAFGGVAILAAVGLRKRRKNIE